MHIRVLVVFCVALGILTSRGARASDAGGGGCSEVTYGMPCDPGDGQACGGVCQPDFSQSGSPMRCFAGDAATLARLKLSTLDGIDCSPSGAPGTDCGHACLGGACIAKNANQGAACLPAGGIDSGLPGIPVSVCSGACDGAGACAALDHGCEKYGRGELDFCLYTACSPATNVPGCEQFASPPGETCSTGDVCVAGETCGSNGLCGTGTRTPGCTEPNADVDAALAARHGPDDAGSAPFDASADARDATSTPPTSGGCSLAGNPTPGTTPAAIFLALGLLSRRRWARRSTARSS